MHKKMPNRLTTNGTITVQLGYDKDFNVTFMIVGDDKCYDAESESHALESAAWLLSADNTEETALDKSMMVNAHNDPVMGEADWEGY